MRDATVVLCMTIKSAIFLQITQRSAVRFVFVPDHVPDPHGGRAAATAQFEDGGDLKMGPALPSSVSEAM
jgi:hypothetical protein